ncbi:membrane anchoring protein efr3a [Blyttiomyces sp. JEL0837]|nr:membrane anchoring protein efr3a [Blyttiomyces sp. JEL0837]
MLKVGAYLEKKVKADIKRNRVGFVKVSLDIVNELMNKCTTHINIMSINVLRIVNDALSYPDPELMLQATATFVLLNSHINHEACVDPDFLKLYSDLVYKFCGYCTLSTRDSLMEKKTHICGLRAIKSVVSSETFSLNLQFENYIKKIIPSILLNIREERRNHQKANQHQQSQGPQPKAIISHRNSIADELFSERELENTAEASLSQLVSRANANSIKLMLKEISSFLDERQEWASTDFVLHVVKVIIGSSPPQYHHLLLSLLLDRLNDDATKNTGTGVGGKDTGSKTSFVQSLIFLVAGGSGTIGLSILEMLGSLVRQIQLMAPRIYGDAATDRPSQLDDTDVLLFASLVEAIGSLAVNIEYPDQVNDIIAFIVNRMKLQDEMSSISATATAAAAAAGKETTGMSRSPTSQPSAELVCVRKALLCALARVLSVRRMCVAKGRDGELRRSGSGVMNSFKEADPVYEGFQGSAMLNQIIGTSSQSLSKSTKRSSIIRTPLSIVLVLPTLCLLASNDVEIRLHASTFLNEFLRLEALENSVTMTADSNSMLIDFLIESPTIANTDFISAIYKNVYDYANLKNLGPADFVAIGSILVAMLRRYFYMDGLASTTQVLFKLQANVENGEIASLPHRQAIGNLMVDYYGHVSRVHDLTNLEDHLNVIRESRKKAGEWSPVLPDLTSDAAYGDLVKSLRRRGAVKVSAGSASSSSSSSPSMPLAFDNSVAEAMGLGSKPFTHLLQREFIVRSLLSSAHIARVPGLQERLEASYVPAEDEKRMARAVAEISKDGGKGVGGRRIEVPTGAGHSHSGSVETKAPASVRSFSIQKNETSPPVKIHELKDALAGKNVMDALNAKGSTSASSMSESITDRGRPDIKGLLRNITSSLESHNKPRSIQEPQMEPFQRNSLESGSSGGSAFQPPKAVVSPSPSARSPSPHVALGAELGKLKTLRQVPSTSSLNSLRLKEPALKILG